MVHAELCALGPGLNGVGLTGTQQCCERLMSRLCPNTRNIKSSTNTCQVLKPCHSASFLSFSFLSPLPCPCRHRSANIPAIPTPEAPRGLTPNLGGLAHPVVVWIRGGQATYCSFQFSRIVDDLTGENESVGRPFSKKIRTRASASVGLAMGLPERAVHMCTVK